MIVTFIPFGGHRPSPRRQAALGGEVEVVRQLLRLVRDEHVQALALAAVRAALEAEPALHHPVTSKTKSHFIYLFVKCNQDFTISPLCSSSYLAPHREFTFPFLLETRRRIISLFLRFGFFHGKLAIIRPNLRYQ